MTDLLDAVRQQTIDLWQEGLSWEEIAQRTGAASPETAMMRARRYAVKHKIALRVGIPTGDNAVRVPPPVNKPRVKTWKLVVTLHPEADLEHMRQVIESLNYVLTARKRIL